MSAEIATSPATRLDRRRGAGGDGNESTSVALSAPRNRRLRDFSSERLVTSTFTVLRKWTASLARSTNRSSVDELDPAILFRRMINSLLALADSTDKINRRARFPPSLMLAALFRRSLSRSVAFVRRLGVFQVTTLHFGVS